MKYSRFEMLIMVLGSAVIVGSIFVPGGVILPQEVVAQLLIVLVLFAAVHKGRNAGFIAALVATLVYVILRIPLMNDQGLTSAIIGMIVVRMLTYAAVGVLGGEICGRIKYFFAFIQGSPLLDDCTQVYNGVYCGQAIRSGISEFRRYKTPFSIALCTIAPSLFSDLRPARQRAWLRATATHIRRDVRLVDDVGHLKDGEFMLLLPQTPRSGAQVVADRVRTSVRDLLGAKDESVTARVLSLPDDTEELCELSQKLDPNEPDSSRNPCSLGSAEDQIDGTSIL
ncbi:MAG: hypothetical protein Q7J82_04890 [Coriobacteriia bacterium]|nr:hypothetical protein [Coriobacteriia bacterium]